MAGIAKRGNIVTVSAAGDYGKPRPAVVIESDWLTGTDSVLVALMTSTLVDAPLFRLPVRASEGIGALDKSGMIALNHMLSVIIGLAN